MRARQAAGCPSTAELDEFLIRGRVRLVDDQITRASLAADWDWSVGNAPAFEFLVEDALYGERASADDWPPRYAAWPG